MHIETVLWIMAGCDFAVTIMWSLHLSLQFKIDRKLTERWRKEDERQTAHAAIHDDEDERLREFHELQMQKVQAEIDEIKARSIKGV